MIKIETAGFILGMVIGLTILTVGASRIYQKYDMLTNWKQIDATITKMNVDSYFQSKMIWGDPAYDWTNEFTREYEYILKKKYTGKSETSFSYASDDGVEEAKAFFHEYSNDKEAPFLEEPNFEMYKHQKAIINLKEGSEISIVVNPNNPNESRAVESIEMFNLWDVVLVLLGLAIIGQGIYAYTNP